MTRKHNPDTRRRQGLVRGSRQLAGAQVAVGWADRGVNHPHRHDHMCEIYLVARGESTAVVNGRRIELAPGSMLVVEPAEAHTSWNSSHDYLHFVVQAPRPGATRSISSTAIRRPIPDS